MPEGTPYDAVPYSNWPYPQTHPDRLATVGILHGLDPAPPASARVLELGCGAGGNLLAMAYASPEMTAVGVDLAAGPIAEARETAREVGIENVALHEADVGDLRGGELGSFDYVIAHGLYAWIPEPARDGLLAAIAAHLAPDGIAYVSYNAYPGGFVRRTLRELALWHARDAEQPVARAEAARELFAFIAEYRIPEDPWSDVLDEELRLLVDAPVSRLVHDELGDDWAPLWFSEFAARAGSHGLAYVDEVSSREVLKDRFPEHIATAMRRLGGGDRIAYEQYGDLVVNRKFRQTLLCHADRRPSDDLLPEGLDRLLFAGRDPGEDAEPDELLARILAVLLERRPGLTGFEDLRAALGETAGELRAALMHGLDQRLISPHVDPPLLAEDPGPRPRASALARFQLGRGEDATTLWHSLIVVEEPGARALVRLLDGTRDHDAIRADLITAGGPELTPEDLAGGIARLASLGLLHDDSDHSSPR